MDELITIGIQLFCLAPIILFAAIKKIKIIPVYFLLSVGYVLVNFALLNCTNDVGGWNWGGKSGAIAFSLIIFLAFPALRAELGFTLTLKSNSIAKSLTAITMLFFAAASLGLTQERTPFNIETILFQLAMPSLDEEMAYRGILLCLLSRGLSASKNSKSNFAAVIITLLFGAVHGVHYSGGDLSIDPLGFLIATAVGAVLMYMRVLSGSIFFPIIGHSIFNVTLLSVPMIHYYG